MTTITDLKEKKKLLGVCTKANRPRSAKQNAIFMRFLSEKPTANVLNKKEIRKSARKSPAEKRSTFQDFRMADFWKATLFDISYPNSKYYPEIDCTSRENFAF